MNIKHGDIITLDSGDTVKVSLEIISKKVTKLEVDKVYELKYSGQWCHGYNSKGYINEPKEYLEKNKFKFIGCVDSKARNIFYCETQSGYVMFGTELNYVVRETN